MTTLEILQAAREHISDPAMWYQGGYSGAQKQRLKRPLRDAEPCCAVGAMSWASHSLGGGWQIQWLSDFGKSILAMERLIDDLHCLAEFNDDPKTTHSDILALFDRAIEAEASQ